MSSGLQEAVRRPDDRPVRVTELCRSVFCCLARADQRRWAETYVRGLLSVPGRKSIRRISEQLVGYRADQSLQQFLNQSPWDCAQVRANLAHYFAATLRPKAWVLAEVAFPKHGASSVAVTRQYAPSLGRTVNCQLGIAALLATEQGSCPVNWRLTLPRGWDDDAERRRRARIPTNERHRPWWQYVLEIIDEMAGTWALAGVPILVDCRHDPRVEPLLRGLDSRGVRYAARVAGGMLIRPAGPRRASATPRPRPMPVGDAAAAVPRWNRTTIACWDGEHGRLSRSQYAVIPISGRPDVHRIVPGRGYQSPPHILVEWTTSPANPTSLWITNLNASRLPALANLLRLPEQSRRDLQRMHEESGLQHFEGRSYPGWHHHVTLVSIAHAYRLLTRGHDGPSGQTE